MDTYLTGLSIFLLEDDLLLRRRLQARLERLGAEVTGAGTLAEARELLARVNADFALLDVNLPDGKVTDLLRESPFPAHTGLIVMTAEGALEGAVEAMRLGVQDYLVKPFDAAELPLALDRARRSRQIQRVQEHRRHQDQLDPLFFDRSLASLQQQLERILAADRRMGETLPPVLIQGETGTGKTTVARWLHRHGPRANQELVEVNCSALPDALAESELFGHERGAFTDARSARIGLFEAAGGGTLFLDELPSLSPALQAKVLTAIEDRSIRRVGGNRTIHVDVRVLAATNRDLRELVRQGAFREDLFHRLDLYRVQLPPLRERTADLLELAVRIMERICQRHRLPTRAITELGKRRLLTYPWPGNIRELAHELERAIVFEDNPELDFPHLLPESEPLALLPAARDWLNEPALFRKASPFSLETGIDRIIAAALKQTDGNVSAAARLLDVPRDYIRYRQKKKGRRPEGK